MTTDVRHMALECLMKITKEEEYSHLVIGEMLKNHQYLEKQDRALLTRLCEGTMENKIRIDYVIDQYSNTKVNKMKPFIRNLMRMAVYQILFMDKIPDSAACNEAVKLAQKKGFVNLKGFINGVLRTIVRNKDEIKYPDKNTNFKEYLSVMYSMPMWIIDQWLESYSKEEVEVMLNSFLMDDKTTIRCNDLITDVETLTNELSEEGIQVSKGIYVNGALTISGYDHINAISSFKEGKWFVQDESSMISVEAAGIKEGDFVVDVCSAPGGKTLYAAMKTGITGKVSARDVSAYKTNMIIENLMRCKMGHVSVKIHDGTMQDSTIMEQADVVIADLPCSGLGVMGRKPDIKYKADKNKINELVELQRQILSTVKDYVKPGGVLMFSTCTIQPLENEENAKWFAQNFDFEPESLDPYLAEELRCDSSKNGELQLLPGIHSTNGFYMARFKKM